MIPVKKITAIILMRLSVMIILIAIILVMIIPARIIRVVKIP